MRIHPALERRGLALTEASRYIICSGEHEQHGIHRPGGYLAGYWLDHDLQVVPARQDLAFPLRESAPAGVTCLILDVGLVRLGIPWC